MKYIFILNEKAGKRRIHKFRANHVEIELEEEVIFNVDGEKLTNKKFVIDILPKAITVYNDNKFVEEIMKSKQQVSKEVLLQN